MLAAAKALHHLALALWVGAVVVVSFVVAPAVFRALPSETAGAVMGQVFPLYYAFTSGAGVVALVSAWWLRRRTNGIGVSTAVVAMLAVMLAATVYAGTVVSPRARALRPALHVEEVDPAVRAEFDALHRRAVQLNGLVLLLGLATIVSVARAVRLPGE
jgi:uncharacterized membrane protein